MRRRRAPAPRPAQPEGTALTTQEEELLKRLFSDPTKYPQTLKTWIISWLEGSDLSLPMYSVNGLKDRLAAAGGSNMLGSYTTGNTDANGYLHVVFAKPVTSVYSVVVTRQGGPPPGAPLPGLAPNAQLSVINISVAGFDIFCWNPQAQAAFANYGITAAWIAYVVP